MLAKIAPNYHALENISLIQFSDAFIVYDPTDAQ